MTRKPLDIRLVHAGDLPTKEAHALLWSEGELGLRYQELAIVGDQVVGAWQYHVEWQRGKAKIDSSHTGVATRFRRRGIAQALWMHGVARWKPVSIEATIGTDEGRDFLARMMARLAYLSPETRLWVKPRNEDANTWESLCDFYAHELLNRLGKERIAREATKKLPKPKLEVVNG